MARKSKLQILPEGMAIEQDDELKPIEIKAASLRGLFCNYSYDHTVRKVDKLELWAVLTGGLKNV